MGTTTTALLLRPEGAWVSHVGDSRVYRVRDGWIEQLSYDHSLLWEYARIKHMDPEDVLDIPSNVIHRCLGPEPMVQIDVEGPYSVRPGDVFLLCSDGLSGQVTDPEMGAVVTVLPPAEACQFLIDLANLRGGPDNITALVVHVTSERGGQGRRRAAEARGDSPTALVAEHLGGGRFPRRRCDCDGSESMVGRPVRLCVGVGGHSLRLGGPRSLLSAGTEEAN